VLTPAPPKLDRKAARPRKKPKADSATGGQDAEGEGES
jgi:hypothetical protein